MKKNLIFTTIICLFSIAAIAAKPTTFSDMVQSFYAAVDAGDFDKAGDYLSDDIKVHIPFSPQAMDKMSYKQLGMGMKAGFPDMKHHVLEVSEGKGTLAFKGLFSGTNTGSLQGNPPTGNRVESPFLGFLKLDKKGKITEFNLQFDVNSFNQQLMKGINPAAAIEINIRAMLAAADAGDGMKFMSFWADNAANYFAGKLISQEDMKKRIASFKAAFPDIKRNLEMVLINGNTVTVRGWVTGTNLGKFMGNEPTGNPIKISWLGFYKLNDGGKVEAGWVEFDIQELANQVLGGNKTEANKKAALKIMEMLDKRDLEGVCTSFAPGAMFNGWTPQPVDVNGYRAAMSDLLAAFPDSHFQTDDIIAEGNKVVVRHHFTGTHTGAKFQGTPPSNKKAVVPATVTYRFEDGKPVELWLNADFLGLLIQIGAIPMPK